MQEQRQLERSSTRSRPDRGDVPSICSAQAGFHARPHLYKVCIMSNIACCFDPYELSCPSCELLLFQVFQLTTLVIRGPATHREKFMINLDRVAIPEEEVLGVLLCVQNFVRSPHFTQRSFFSESGLTMLSESVAIADSITSNPVYAPWKVVESAGASQVITDLCACWGWVVMLRRTAIDTSECWYHGSTPRSETASRPGVRTMRRNALSTCQLLLLLLVLLECPLQGESSVRRLRRRVATAAFKKRHKHRKSMLINAKINIHLFYYTGTIHPFFLHL